MRLSRMVVTLDAVLFIAVGVGFWVAPLYMANLFHIDPVGLAGLAVLRADFGGLFLGLGLLALGAVWAPRRTLTIAGAVVLLAVIAGRLIAILAHGWSAAGPSMLFIEVQAVVALLLSAKSAASAQAPAVAFSRRGTTAVGVSVLLVLGAAGLSLLLLPGVDQWLFARGAMKAAAKVNRAPLEDDALRVAICGSSSPLASGSRAKACVAVFAGGKLYLVDVGPESVKNLLNWNIPLAEVGGVLLTHFHSDHIGDLGELNLQTWAQGRPAPLPVYGGPGVARVVNGFNDAYRLDQGYRTAHHTAALMDPDRWPMIPREIAFAAPATTALDRSAPVLEDGDLRITAIEVNHEPVAPAFAYRFDYRGRSVVITGDTKYHAPLATAAQGADLLLSEAISRPMIAAMQRGAVAAGRSRVASIMHDIQDYHISPEEAASLANQAHVRLLVFYHLLPAPDGLVKSRAFTRGLNAIRTDWTVADDGSLYTLPIGSDHVRIGRIGS